MQLRTITLKPGERLTKALLKRSGGIDSSVIASATAIIEDVCQRGDEALYDYSAKFDGVEKAMLGELRVSQEEIDAAFELVDDELVVALEFAAEQIRDFHSRQVRQSWFTNPGDGIMLGSKITPLNRVGIYVPGGRAQYPSSVLMNALPAECAGVESIVMVAPPTKEGTIAPITLVAAAIAGVTEIYKVGGAQAIAALAYGTESIPAVDKIVGPGNAYVAAAKKIVNGDVGIDMIAGPSEVLILADETAVPAFIAIDMMAQAEHDPRAATYLATTDETLIPLVEEALDVLLAETPRADITRQALENNSVAVVCADEADAVAASDFIAPEHLEVHMDHPFELLGEIHNAGAIFLGPWTPEAIGDYVAGPNHVLPTGGTARFSSPLSVDDFIKKSSVISYSVDALAQDAPAVETIATQEGLWSHARSVSLRLDFLDALENDESDDDGQVGENKPSKGNGVTL